MATEKQQRALENLVENGGNVSRAMRDAGYSENTAKTPSKLTTSKGYQDLLDAYLPDDMLLRALSDDIEKKEGNRKAELELAFKLKGKMIEKQDLTSNGQTLQVVVPGPVAQAFNVNPNSNGETSGIHPQQEAV
jgi:hypothetical protein